MPRGVIRTIPVFGVLLFVGAAVGCGSDPAAPTPTAQTDNYNGTIGPLGSAAHTFTVSYQGSSDASVTVTSLTSVATGATPNITVGIGFGNVNLGACTVAVANATAPLNSELATQGAPFTGPQQYCVEIFDNPNAPTITEPLSYTLAVKHF